MSVLTVFNFSCTILCFSFNNLFGILLIYNIHTGKCRNLKCRAWEIFKEWTNLYNNHKVQEADCYGSARALLWQSLPFHQGKSLSWLLSPWINSAYFWRYQVVCKWTYSAYPWLLLLYTTLLRVNVVNSFTLLFTIQLYKHTTLSLPTLLLMDFLLLYFWVFLRSSMNSDTIQILKYLV